MIGEDMRVIFEILANFFCTVIFKPRLHRFQNDVQRQLIDALHALMRQRDVPARFGINGKRQAHHACRKRAE